MGARAPRGWGFDVAYLRRQWSIERGIRLARQVPGQVQYRGAVGKARMVFACGLFACASLLAQTPPVDPALQPVIDDPQLPRILLIGDSISMGYTPLVREAFAGKANVHHPPENCEDTGRGLAHLD